MKFTIWRVLTAIILIVLIAAAWYLYTLNSATALANARLAEQKKSIEKELEGAYKQKGALATELEDIKKEKESLINKINDFDASIQELNAAHQAKIDEMTDKIDKLNMTLAQKEDALKALSEKDAEINFLKKIVQNSRDKIDELTKKLGKRGQAGEKNGAISLQPITITPEKAKVTGKVIELNTDYEFIIVNLGSKDGIKAGDTLFVSRNMEVLGKVVVEKVRDSVSVAKILYKSLTYAVRKGDTVSN